VTLSAAFIATGRYIGDVHDGSSLHLLLFCLTLYVQLRTVHCSSTLNPV